MWGIGVGTMKRILFLAAAIGLGLTQGARSADMSVHGLSPSPFFLPPVNSMPDWSGFYIGFNGGYGFASSSVSANFFGPIVAAGEPPRLLDRRKSGGRGFRRTGGLQLAMGELGVRRRGRF